MSYFYRPPNEEERILLGQQKVPGTGGVPEGGQSGVPGASAQPSSDFTSPQRAGFSGFADINAYLDKNAPQADALGESIGGNLKKEAEALTGEIGSAGQNFRSLVDEGAVRPDEDLVTRAATDPSNFIQNADDVGKFTSQRDAFYGGPGSFEETDLFPDISKRLKEGERKAGLIESDAGRKELLFEIGKNSSRGEVELDNLLLTGSPSARKILEEGSASFDPLPSHLETVSGESRSYADQAKADADAARALVQNRFLGEGGAIPTFESDLAGRLGSARSEANTRADRAAQILSDLVKMDPNKLNFTEQELGDLDFTEEQLRELFSPIRSLKYSGRYNDLGMLSQGGPHEASYYWLDGDPDFYNTTFQPTQYGTKRSADEAIRRENFASPDDYARYMALSELMGMDPSFLRPENVGQAGTADLDIYDIDAGETIGAASGALRGKDLQLLRDRIGAIKGVAPENVTEQMIRDAWQEPGIGGMYANKLGNVIGWNPNRDIAATERALVQAARRQGFFDPAQWGITNDQIVGPIYGTNPVN